MLNIKYFKYINKKSFNIFLKECGYSLNDVKGFSCFSEQQYHGNILKEYKIYFSNSDECYFKVVYFKSFNEYKQSSLGFNGNKLLQWYESANIRKYKLNID